MSYNLNQANKFLYGDKTPIIRGGNSPVMNPEMIAIDARPDLYKEHLRAITRSKMKQAAEKNAKKGGI